MSILLVIRMVISIFVMLTFWIIELNTMLTPVTIFINLGYMPFGAGMGFHEAKVWLFLFLDLTALFKGARLKTIRYGATNKVVRHFYCLTIVNNSPRSVGFF